MATPNHSVPGPLHGTGVLVTRPVGQAEGLCGMITAAGGVAVRFPVLEIEPLPVDAVLAERFDRLERFDLAIFISANAVEYGIAAVRGQRDWPARLRVAAVGRATAAALEQRGVAVDLCPRERFDSEGLLALDALQAVSGQRIIIFRGIGGRETLAETLRTRGAQVEYAQTYRRARPVTDPAPLLVQMAAGEVGLVVVSSGESYLNLDAMVGVEGQPLLRRMSLVVASERVLQVAWDAGWRGASRVARDASDRGLFEAMLALRSELDEEPEEHE